MALLHIYDSSDRMIVQTVNSRGGANRLAIPNANNFLPAMDALLATGATYDRILFETHGSPGRILFNKVYIDAAWWLSIPGRFNRLTTPNSRIYFNGCNVAEGANGWSFLEAAAGVFMQTGGGQIFGQTSMGFGNPFNGHVVHLWGSTRTLFIDATGRIVERFEQ